MKATAIVQPLIILQPPWEENQPLVLSRPEPDFLFHTSKFYSAWASATGIAHHVFVRMGGLELFGHNLLGDGIDESVSETQQEIVFEQGEFITPLAWVVWTRERFSLTIPERIDFFGWSLPVCSLPLIGRFCGATVFRWWEYHVQLIYQANPILAVGVIAVWAALILQSVLLAWLFMKAGTGPDIDLSVSKKQQIKEALIRPSEVPDPGGGNGDGNGDGNGPPTEGLELWLPAAGILGFMGLGVLAAGLQRGR